MARAQGAAGVRAAPCRITSIAQGYINIEQAFQYGGLLDSPIQLSAISILYNNRLCLYYSTDCKTEVLVSVAHARGIPMQLVFAGSLGHQPNVLQLLNHNSNAPF